MTQTKILIAEDEVIVREYIKTALERYGFTVCAAVSKGEDILKEVQRTSPNLALLDIKLKGKIDGIKAAEKIHENYEIPIIYLTAYADKATLERAKKTKPFGYIVKPFEEIELYSTIEIVLEKHKEQQEEKNKLTKEIQKIKETVSIHKNSCKHKEYPLKEAAKYLSINEKTIRRMIKENIFPLPSSIVDIGNNRKARCWTQIDLDNVKQHIRKQGRPKKEDA